MSIALGLAIYFVLWWITLLVTLPFGVRNSHEAGEATEAGHDPGAPVAAGLARKMLWTTLISGVLFLIFLANHRYGWITFDMLPGPDKLY